MLKLSNRWIIFLIVFLSSVSCAHSEIFIRVPHLLEYGEDIGVISGAQTCGPCSLEMCAAYLQHREADFNNVKKINMFLAPEKASDEYYLSHGQSTSCDDLVAAAKQMDIYGFQGLQIVDFSIERIKKEIWNKSPVILTLANYGAISNREDKGYAGGHIMVISGYDEENATCQDPDSKEQNIRYSWQEVEASIGGYKMIVGFKVRPVEDEETSLFSLKDDFLQGGIFVMPGGTFIYKTWIVEQVGNHVMIVEEKMLAPMFGGERKRVVDLRNCFLGARENSPIGKNCVVIEMKDSIDLIVDQPAVKIEQSSIYISPKIKKFMYEAVPENSRNSIRLDLDRMIKKEPLPKEVTDEILADAENKWFTP